MRTYDELIEIDNYIDRYEYLRIGGRVGQETFGDNRYLNQILYKSEQWLEIRDEVIIRDNGCDLAMPGYEIEKPNIILVHHMNPISVEDILNGNPDVFDPRFLISVAFKTHSAIHYGDSSLLMIEPIVRVPGDTCPWRK